MTDAPRASGSSAAVAGAMAADVVAMAARAAAGWKDAPGVAAQARQLATRLRRLADADAEAFARVVALREDPTADARDLGPALERAADVPLAVADAAAATAELAALTAGWAVGYERADAIAAAALAEGAARAAAALVHANLATTRGSPRALQADDLVRTASAAREAAAEAG